MSDTFWPYERTPSEHDDTNRLGFLFEGLKNDLHFGLAVDSFVTVLSSAFQGEFDCRKAKVYPPAGHGYPRLED